LRAYISLILQSWAERHILVWGSAESPKREEKKKYTNIFIYFTFWISWILLFAPPTQRA